MSADVILATDEIAPGISWAFFSPAVLPFGSEWQVVGNAADLAGHALEQPAPYSVITDPGEFLQDGFESPPNALFVGSAELLSKLDSNRLLPINGSDSVLLAADGSITLHLTAPSDVTSLRFNYQRLSKHEGPVAINQLDIGVGGIGSSRVSFTATGTAYTGELTEDPTWPYSGIKEEFSVALSDLGRDLVLRITLPRCYVGCDPPSAVLIDDVRVE